MATKKEFAEATALLLTEFTKMKPIEGPRMKMWWKALGAYPDGTILSAVERHIMTSTFEPQLADIVRICDAQLDGQWLGPDEAWALVPKSEHDSAMLTDEIAQAVAVATPLLAVGDKMAARMAFKDAYTRLVEQARIAARQPRYFPSFGTDVQGRVKMLATAVLRGQVSIDRAIEWQPERGRDILRMANVQEHPMLEAPSKSGQKEVKLLLANLRSIE